MGAWRACAVVLLAASALYLAGGIGSSWWIEGPGLVNAAGKPVGRDFLAFWAAARLTLEGRPAAAYDVAAIAAVQAEAIGAAVKPVAWHYPPPFLLAVLPLSLLPYLAALALWLLLPLAALAWLLRRLWGNIAWLALLFPAVAQSLISGQNGVVSACLLGGGLVLLDRRPWLAGVLLGLMAYKPHLALLIGPALLAGRHWRAAGAALLTAAAAAAASLALLGPAPWAAFLDNADFVREVVEGGRLPLARFPTVFAAALLLGAGFGTAYAAQGLAALGAAAAVAWLFRKRAPLPLRGSGLALAMPLATPYAFDYDLVPLLLAIGWLLAGEGGRSRVVRALAAALWAMPVAAWLLALHGGVQVAPAILAAALAVVLRQAAAGPHRLANGPARP